MSLWVFGQDQMSTGQMSCLCPNVIMSVLTRGRREERVREEDVMTEANGVMGTIRQEMQAGHTLEVEKGKETTSALQFPEEMKPC